MINQYKSYTWFSNNFVLKKSTKGWWLYACPMCNEVIERKKMAVNFSYEVVKCWICGYKERMVDFVAEYLNTDYRDAKNTLNGCVAANIDLEDIHEIDRAVISDVDLPVGYKSILTGDGILAVRARNYLLERGFDLNELDKKGIGYCNEHNDDDSKEDFFGYIIIPFKRKGKLIYYIGRDYIGNFLRYKNPSKENFGVGKADVIFNEDALYLCDEVYVSEGWADACEMGKSGTSTQGWSMSVEQKRQFISSDVKSMVFIPDVGVEQGRSFYSRAVEAAMDYMDYKTVYVLDLSAYEELGKDANEIGRENIIKLRKEAVPLDFGTATEILMEVI